MHVATNRDDADAFRVEHRSAVVSTPLSVQLGRWLTEAWTRREQRRIERLVLEIGHPGARNAHRRWASPAVP
jgi:hypothetical protein